jgi:tripartite-type tricarboxylate transporter receptor subunit TctC
MKIARRRLLAVTASLAAVAATSRGARADSYPSRPVHVIVPQAAASASDIVGRLISQWLADHLGQQFVVDDRPGAGGSVGTEIVVRAPADGYTLLIVNSQNALNAALYANLSYNFLRDIVPVAHVESVALVMEVNPSVPAKNIPEFITFAKANPGKINMASAGIGGPQHVAGELFKTMAGVDLVHVPYRGTTPALTDLLAGEVQVMFDVTPTALPQIRAGKLRALGVTSSKRIDWLPDVPAIAEFVPGYEATAWLGIGAPTGTPAEIVDLLNKTINAGLADAKMKARFDELGAVLVPGTPTEFATFIAAETEKWGKVIRDANIKAD